MLRALELAARGLGHTSPNPQVGCVITRNNSIIGEGWHMKYGEAHAEVNAINQVPDQEWLKESEMYVTLEPCSHYGKTPPCADLIISKGIRKVFISQVDPNPVVNGRGIKKLKDAGIMVETGLLENDARILNKRYLTAFHEGRPYVILKWAQSLDGYIARENYDSKWISNDLSRQLVHKWRSEEDAVLVGFNTARYDNPQLNVRNWAGRNPLRVVIDTSLELPKDLKIYDNSQATAIINTIHEDKNQNTEWIKVSPGNMIPPLLKQLCDKGIYSVMVEGGSATISEFIVNDLWDEARVFTGNKMFRSGIQAPELKSQQLYESKNIGDDSLMIYKRINSR